MIIALSGVPGSGKSTICRLLNEHGMKCINAVDIPGSDECRDGDEMDLECLKGKLRVEGDVPLVVEGHYSHLLGCSAAIILERDEVSVREALVKRGYPQSKIDGNIDALLSDTIYQEALQFLPGTLIRRVRVVEGSQERTFSGILECIHELEKRIKSR